MSLSLAAPDSAAVHAAIAQLAQSASIEINAEDAHALAASRRLLSPGRKLYVSHLPKQTWNETIAACREVRAAGFSSVPHIPARLLTDERTLDELLCELIRDGAVSELLLIAGDYARPQGPYAQTLDILRGGLLAKHGVTRISIAGHPEGHPGVCLAEIRRAEREKAVFARENGLEVSFLTQFFFEAPPFLHWANELHAHGVRANIVGGLAGPARITTLFKYAMRCGVGPSIRALGASPSSIAKLIGERGPETIVRALAEARLAGRADFSGIHLFSFGGYLRTCRWLHAVATGGFTLNERGGFDLT